MNQTLLTAALLAALNAPPAPQALVCYQAQRVDTPTTGALHRFVPYLTTWEPIGPEFDAAMQKSSRTDLTLTVGAHRVRFDVDRTFWLSTADDSAQLIRLAVSGWVVQINGGPSYRCRPLP